ncbi:MAG: hypothetical protein SFY81_11205 [Verrucomicrobiota bacterium]|nr:hypothetical protein [Verrucomicrobiota bacterium]
MSDSPTEKLLIEYSEVFRDMDDLTLARWMAQTLGQLSGRCVRMSHPLVTSYRLAAQIGHARQIWLKRLATAPAAFSESTCCRTPLVPLLTRDVSETGLICQHCGETAVPFDDIPEKLRAELHAWSRQYAPIHAVAHWDERQRQAVLNYQQEFEKAATLAEGLLQEAGSQIGPKMLDDYPMLIWEDQDECLEVEPEDLI